MTQDQKKNLETQLWGIANLLPGKISAGEGNQIWLRNISKYPKFLEIVITWNKNILIKYSIGSTQKALTIIELNKIKFRFPSLKEQQKIADCLSSMGQSINKLKKQIEQTTQFKKGLLQRMFV